MAAPPLTIRAVVVFLMLVVGLGAQVRAQGYSSTASAATFAPPAPPQSRLQFFDESRLRSVEITRRRLFVVGASRDVESIAEWRFAANDRAWEQDPDAVPIDASTRSWLNSPRSWLIRGEERLKLAGFGELGVWLGRHWSQDELLWSAIRDGASYGGSMPPIVIYPSSYRFRVDQTAGGPAAAVGFVASKGRWSCELRSGLAITLNHAQMRVAYEVWGDSTSALMTFAEDHNVDETFYQSTVQLTLSYLLREHCSVDFRARSIAGRPLYSVPLAGDSGGLYESYETTTTASDLYLSLTYLY